MKMDEIKLQGENKANPLVRAGRRRDVWEIQYGPDPAGRVLVDSIAACISADCYFGLFSSFCPAGCMSCSQRLLTVAPIAVECTLCLHQMASRSQEEQARNNAARLHEA
jgi:hypothetical protein